MFDIIFSDLIRKIEIGIPISMTFTEWLMAHFQNLTIDEIMKDESLSRLQSEDEYWYKLRRGCVTSSMASKFLSVCTRPSLPSKCEQFNFGFKLQKQFSHILKPEPSPPPRKNFYNGQFGLENENTVKILLEKIVVPGLYESGYLEGEDVNVDVGFVRSQTLNFIGSSPDAIQGELFSKKSSSKTLIEIKCLMDVFVENLATPIDEVSVFSLLDKHLTLDFFRKEKKFFSCKTLPRKGHSAFVSYFNHGKQLSAIIVEFTTTQSARVEIERITELSPGKLIACPYHPYAIQVAIQSFTVVNCSKGYLCVPIFSRQKIRNQTIDDTCEMTFSRYQFPIKALIFVPVALNFDYVNDIVNGIKKNFSLLYFLSLCEDLISREKAEDFSTAANTLARLFKKDEDQSLIYLHPLKVSRSLNTKSLPQKKLFRGVTFDAMHEMDELSENPQ